MESERRVSLSAVLLMTYGVGACVGPMIAGVLMSWGGHSMYYMFVSACALILVWQVRPTRVTGAHQVQEAPTHFVPMPDTLQSSPASAVLDPRVDPETDITIEMVEPDPATAAVQSVDPVAAEAVVAGAAPAAAAAPGAAVSEAAADHPAAAEAARDMGYEAGMVPDAKDLDEEARTAPAHRHLRPRAARRGSSARWPPGPAPAPAGSGARVIPETPGRRSARPGR